MASSSQGGGGIAAIPCASVTPETQDGAGSHAGEDKSSQGRLSDII